MKKRRPKGRMRSRALMRAIVMKMERRRKRRSKCQRHEAVVDVEEVEEEAEEAEDGEDDEAEFLPGLYEMQQKFLEHHDGARSLQIL